MKLRWNHKEIMPKKIRYILMCCCGSILLNIVCVRSAFAYLDLGSGSYIFQLLIASLVGALFMMKPFFLKIKATLRKIFIRNTEDDHTP